MNEKNIKDNENFSVKTYDEYIPPRQDMYEADVFTLPGNGGYSGGAETETEHNAAQTGKKAAQMLHSGCTAEETLEMLRRASHVRKAENTDETEKKKFPAEPEKKTLPVQKKEDKFRLLGEIADEIASQIPAEIYSKLSGGIVLSENIKLHEKSNALRPLYILGEYINSPHLGRHIALYGGSILRVYGNMNRNALKKELERIIKHELTHHWESLSGVRDLEIYDAARLEDYKEDIERLGGGKEKQER